MAAKAVIISNYSISALAFWGSRERTVEIPRQFTTSDATVITFLISNFVA